MSWASTELPQGIPVFVLQALAGMRFLRFMSANEPSTVMRSKIGAPSLFDLDLLMMNNSLKVFFLDFILSSLRSSEIVTPGPQKTLGVTKRVTGFHWTR